jgi:hypothetical protein
MDTLCTLSLEVEQSGETEGGCNKAIQKNRMRMRSVISQSYLSGQKFSDFIHGARSPKVHVS